MMIRYYAAAIRHATDAMLLLDVCYYLFVHAIDAFTPMILFSSLRRYLR